MLRCAMSLKHILPALLTLTLPTLAHAHVKWFTQSTDRSVIHPDDLNHLWLWFLLGLSVLTIAAFVWIDHALTEWKPFVRFNAYLESQASQATVILRVFTGAALLLSWQADSIIAPELHVAPGAGWFQFAIALLLLTPFTTPLAGLGMLGLYAFAMSKYGFFHMLDYLVYPAIGFYLFASIFKSQRLKQTRIPILYIGLGFSLCWAALEKVFFPQWGLDVLRQEPGLSMGLPHEFFLLACAFVELCLGYLLIIGLLQRPLAIVITLVFITTSAFFGKTEIIGHTILHGTLLAFSVLGPGRYYPAPIEFHQNLSLRSAFAAINFVLVTGVLGAAYYLLASAHA